MTPESFLQVMGCLPGRILVTRKIQPQHPLLIYYRTTAPIARTGS